MYIKEEARHQRETMGNMRLGNPKSLEIIKLNNYRTDASYAKGINTTDGNREEDFLHEKLWRKAWNDSRSIERTESAS